MIKTNIKMRVTPEQSKKVQEICFENQIRWSGEGRNVSYIDRPFLYIDDNYLKWANIVDNFILKAQEEIDADLFIRTNGTCVEEIKPKNNFKEFGFEADFEGEILKEYENQFIGMVYQNEGNFGCSWDKQGICLQPNGFGYINMNLKPIEKQEFTYPMWFKSKSTGDIVEFIGLKTGKLVVENVDYINRSVPIEKNKIQHSWIAHTNDNWEQVEKPKDIEDNKDNSINNGGSTDYYKLPKDTKDLQDLIEYKDMNFALGNIFKAVYRLGNCSHSDAVRDLNKIVYFANRELLRLKRENGE